MMFVELIWNLNVIKISENQNKVANINLINKIVTMIRSVEILNTEPGRFYIPPVLQVWMSPDSWTQVSQTYLKQYQSLNRWYERI